MIGRLQTDRTRPACSTGWRRPAAASTSTASAITIGALGQREFCCAARARRAPAVHHPLGHVVPARPTHAEQISALMRGRYQPDAADGGGNGDRTSQSDRSGTAGKHDHTIDRGQ